MSHGIVRSWIGRAVLASWVASSAGCTTALYQASGEYVDADSHSREILLQWKAQKYYIPFVNAEVDHGSISLQAECMPDVLLDHKNSKAYGLVFVERLQDYRLAPGAADYRLGNYRVCAMFDERPPIEVIGKSPEVDLLILCESKHNVPFLTANESGYPLTIAEGKEERTLSCRP